MNTQTVRRIARNMSDNPQRGPRTRDRRARERQEIRNMADAYRHGYTDELED